VNAPSSRFLYRLLDISYAIRVSSVLPRSDITITNSVSLPLLIPSAKAGKIYVSVARYPKGQMFLYARAHRLQAVSKAVAEAIRRQSPSAYSRVRVLPNSLSPIFSTLRSPSSRNRFKDILYVGRFAREKGLELLIRAFLLVPGHRDWTLTLLGPSGISAGGDGEAYLAGLKSICELDRNRIRLAPAIFDERALASRIQESEIFVYPSVAEKGESFGMAPLEAMAAGCAVIVSGLECFRDFAINGKNALIFDHVDDSGRSLAEVLQTLMDSPRLRTDLATAAIESARAFSPENVAQMFLRDFTDLVPDNVAH
jgi:glycosyltransferase involved in cell wall biosynthesis